ncbi:hypothetical protein ALC56_13941 [Trachymyrmex septentrionalis]|uniref:Uncharacterized protein n=2 Tax=Trachymyrmex septentrionalis TaxID=34720 RepID=A0A195EV82_9HYME|nr:hypothetical protein ALC56_13941 [Trachymyrmex septentrionalis]
MRLLCTSFILSLAGQQLLKNQNSRNVENSRDSDDDGQDNASDVSDIEVSPPSKPVVTSTNEKEDMDEDANAQFISHDWSFLSAIFPDQENIL